MAVWFYYLAEEFPQGHPHPGKRTNPLHWDYFRLNLPGNPTYDPTLKRVMKWDKLIKSIAEDIVSFVDHLRVLGYSVE
jgi:hypothetical protein